MKKLLAIVLVISILLSFSACCVRKERNPSESETTPPDESVTEAPKTTEATLPPESEPKETEVTQKKMPEVIGLPLSEALALLSFFSNVETKNVYSDKAAGIVVDQSADVGAILSADNSIVLSVSIGKAPEASKFPYLETVKFSDEAIYSGPGYEYNYAGTVEVAGVYTIVDEAYDAYGELWGKLKSGAGWINLSHSRNHSTPVGSSNYFVKAYRAGDNEKGDVFIPDSTIDYAQKIGFQASKSVVFELYEINVMVDPAEIVRYLGTGYLSAGETLIAEIGFHGDFTTYEIKVTDDYGVMHRYELSQSLMDGSLCFTQVS